MFDFKNYSIRLKLILIFIIFKILPLLLLAGIGISSFLGIESLMQKNSQDIIKNSQKAISKTADLVIADSIKALDKKSQDILEKQTVLIAKNIANFLYARDKDILYLAKTTINQANLQRFYKSKIGYIHVPIRYLYDDKNGTWLPVVPIINSKISERTKLKDNTKEFHKVNFKPLKMAKKLIYKEITYYNLKGQEIYKVSQINAKLKNISEKKNTFLKAEDYYKKSLKLKKGEIYVSHMIGEYIGSPIIGVFNKKRAKKAGIKFEPKKYGYAGVENPVGKRFDGIIRFVTPVFKKGKKVGFLSLALDHRYIMDFTDYFNPLHVEPLAISDASSGNYAFMWGDDFRCISHPREYFINGYNAKSGEKVPGWIDSKLAKEYKKSGIKDMNTFLKGVPVFYNQSLKKKPNLAQLKKGQVGLDCRYLNFAPQCEGWNEILNDGGYGSFVIYWSGVWKLTTAAPIPYYTGQYGKSKLGFGFVTIGANVKDFHKAATKTKEKVGKILNIEKKNVGESIVKTTKKVYSDIKNQINKISFATLLLMIIVIYIAILLSNYITNRINKIIIGTQKLKEKKFNYHIELDSKDEIGKLTNSFNEMADSIYSLNQDLNEKLYIDDLTKLKSRRSFNEDVKKYKKPILYLIDIDLFKNINDYYGIKAGNFILIEFAQIILKIANENSMAAYRIGSDEFLLLKDTNFSSKKVGDIVSKLFKIVTNRVFVNEELNINTTIDITIGVTHGKGNLLEEADLALNEAKNKKISFMIFNNTNIHMNRYKENILWRQKIQYAIANDNIVPYYQEIVDIKNPKNNKYECLVRLIDEDKVISPCMFLNIARETKLYPELTKIMIKKSFHTFKNIDASFSINLSIDDINNVSTVKFIKEKIKEYEVGNRVIFELLESEEINDFDKMVSFIQEMKKMGARFAIDDFGSGYSNFVYLLKIQPDFIKIDGSLIKNLKRESNEYHMVEAIVKFAKTLKIKIIAEFVCSKEIVEILEDFNIDYMQGYYFSEPQQTLVL